MEIDRHSSHVFIATDALCGYNWYDHLRMITSTQIHLRRKCSRCDPVDDYIVLDQAKGHAAG